MCYPHAGNDFVSVSTVLDEFLNSIEKVRQVPGSQETGHVRTNTHFYSKR